MTSVSFPYQFNTGLSNPSGSQDYTIRVYRLEDCYIDYTVTMNQQDCTMGCTCEEYIYLAEPGINAMLKFRIDNDGRLTEIIKSDGSHWSEGFTNSPHGVGADQNGILYLGSGGSGGIDRYNCDGTLLEEDYIPKNLGDGMSGVAGNQNNIYVVGNTLYANGWYGTGYLDAVVAAYDVCSGNLLGTYTVCDETDDLQRTWDFVIDEELNQIIINTYAATRGFAVGDLDTNLNGACLEIIPGTANGHATGATKDNDGNIYARHFSGNLTKYDSLYNMIYRVPLDPATHAAWGIVYSETTGNLYLSGNGGDCVSVYDPADGSYLYTGYPIPPDPNNNKAMNILKECCPTNNNVTIDTTLCAAAINDTLFLQKLLNCEGTICEGLWQEGGGNNGLTYNSCNNSIIINAANACGTFTLASDGAGNAPQCGAFIITININVVAQPEAKVFAIQPSCTNGIPNSNGYLQISEITSGERYNWSVGSTYSGDPDFADAIDATALSFPHQFNTGMSNPSGAQDYTIRIFSAETTCGEHCYTDYTVTMNEQDCTADCNCTEMIYLNEPSSGGKVHKYSINTTSGGVTELFNSNNAWYPGPNPSELPSPHGLGTDLNGFLYIADSYGSGNIRRLDCDGNIYPTSDFLIANGGQTGNIQSVGNTLYTNQRNSYDICSQNPLGNVILGDAGASTENWGFYIDQNTGYHYSTKSEDEINVIGEIWRYTAADYGTGIPVAPFITFSDFQAIFPTFGYEDRVRGIVTDNLGHLYVNVWDYNFWPGGTTVNTWVVKFDEHGNYMNHITDSVDGDGGFFYAAGLVYSEATGLIYGSTQSNFEDCMFTLDKNLNYIRAAVDASGDTGQGQSGFNWSKAIALKKECCPTNNHITIDTILCPVSVNDTVLLQELINCNGIICEGRWQEGISNTGMPYNTCNNSVTIDSLGVCGTFTLESDGTGANSQCGAFKIIVNICAGCFDWGDLPDLSATTTILDYQTDSTNIGPSHLIIDSLFIGATVDGEPNGLASSDALGDGADEDGFNFPSTMNIVPGGTMNMPLDIVNTTGTTAHYEIWIDWNGDGDFDDPNEMVADLSDDGFGNFGQTHFTVNIPADATTDQLLGFRARLSHTDNMTPYGVMDAGEVEDYLIELTCDPNICLPVQITIPRD